MDDLGSDSPTVESAHSGVAQSVAGRYRIRERLGRGATKEVYLAHDELLDRHVALAIVVGAGTAAARARVEREAKITGRLGDHPNVITVYDVGEIPGPPTLPYLVLRTMPGGSLADLLERERPSPADAVRLAGEIAAALAHAHSHGVVHRDVKPDNVWLAADGSAALGDFGIAHEVGADRLTADGVVVGTVRYLSPEQIRGEEMGPASDLYALGVTLYELVAGRPPFVGDNATQILTQHLTAQPEPPSRHARAIPAALETLILALLAKDPAQRPASAADVVTALARIEIDPAAAAPVTPAAPAPRGARRFVSVLAARADVADPEALHDVFERCSAVIEQHGGTVERYLGDALVGFFGLAQAHGDEALRAARAALKLSETAELRLGLESGEVFMPAAPGAASVPTGAAITTAGRLAERAATGEILLGKDIRPAVAADVSIDPASGRLLGVQSGPALLRAHPTPFVGREDELARLRAALQRARAASACELVTVIGAPGIGKTRLAGEFVAAAGDDALVLIGRCGAFGEGTLLGALSEIVRAVAGSDPPARFAQLLDGEEQAIRPLLALVGQADEPASLDETAWALRLLLERLAAERALVVVVEDLHWGQDALLDLLDNVTEVSTGAPILLVCLARPELLERRPQWAATPSRRALLALDPLDRTHARALAQRLGAPARADAIAARADGNPLFVEQLVAVDTDELPASIHAVLAARIDRLDAGARTVLQRGAVEGRTFHGGAIAAGLTPPQSLAVDDELAALVRADLVAPDRSQFRGEHAYRFTHALIRDAAYAGLPKALRAQLHAGVGDWMERRREAVDEVVGYHLEQAVRLRAELGRALPGDRLLAARAVEHLRAASRAALTRVDPGAASALLERALALASGDDSARGALLPALGAALYEAGRLTDATRVFDEAIVRASDPLLEARALVEREFVQLETAVTVGVEAGHRIADAAMPIFERAGDAHGQCRVWSLRAQLALTVGHIGAADDAWAAAADCARHAGDERELFDILGWRASAAMYGPTPVDAAIRRCQGFLAVVGASPVAAMWMLEPLASLHAMKGEFARADELLREAQDVRARLGHKESAVSHPEALIRLLEGKPELAEAHLRAAVERHLELGDGRTLATTRAMLAHTLYGRGEDAEAEEHCAAAAAIAATDDIVTQAMWRGARAKLLARAGRCEEACALAREAVAIIEPTDMLSPRGDAMCDLAEVLWACEREEESERARQTAIALYELKGNRVGVDRARSLLKRGERLHPAGGSHVDDRSQ